MKKLGSLYKFSFINYDISSKIADVHVKTYRFQANLAWMALHVIYLHDEYLLGKYQCHGLCLQFKVVDLYWSSLPYVNYPASLHLPTIQGRTVFRKGHSNNNLVLDYD